MAGARAVGIPTQLQRGPNVGPVPEVPVVNLEDFYTAGAELGISLGASTLAWNSLARRAVLQYSIPDPRLDARGQTERTEGLPSRVREAQRQRALPWPIVFGRMPLLDGHAHDTDDFGDLHVPSLAEYVHIIELHALRHAKGARVNSLDELDERRRRGLEDRALKAVAASGIGHSALAIYRYTIATRTTGKSSNVA